MNTEYSAGLGAKLAAWPEVHSVRRPVAPAVHREFDLHYVRTGPRTDRPVLVIPGGPGPASVVPYRSLRADATALGLDVLMVEHRGVGLSRQDDDGIDLPLDALTIDQVVEDLAAVLDDCGVGQAVVCGSSYGAYLAQGLAVRHPERIAAMVLDSPVLSAHDPDTVGEYLRRLFWEGEEPHTADIARKLRRLVAEGVVELEEIVTVVQVAYAFGGIQPLGRLLDLLCSGRGRRTWRWLARLGVWKAERFKRYAMEFDLVGAIAFRELGLCPAPDGRAFDPNLPFAELAERFPPFEGEPYDLQSALPGFNWPTVVISGEWDLRTPRPIAELIVESLPDGVLVPLTGIGHSILDSHPLAFLHAADAVLRGHHRRLPALAGSLSDDLPRRGPHRLLRRIFDVRLAAEHLLPRLRGDL
ncbi:alpha/beta fold hydrolase [Nonomuraea sp. SYSU D8015]|uniref:alpha/beta fold hydrolase n=1 Tax=Nonomuraea sp. SYSU D8015 TaxID=2593644 RepID=UPI0016610B6A|nr:alpha/beta hydrolase [Nonomuraea sp. SYSU D8015]